MCGIIGIVGHTAVTPLVYDALTILQHRGQDAAGIATIDGHKLHLFKGNGLVRDVFPAEALERLKGHAGIGHVRYPTAGSNDRDEAQPFYVNSPYGIALAHNGNLINTDELKKELFDSDRRHLNTESDSEVLLNVFAHELQALNHRTLQAADVFKAVDRLHQRCSGAYSAIALIAGKGVLGFRDPYAIRPAVLGYRETANGREYAIASESVALAALDFTLMRDLKPAETVFITLDGKIHYHESPLAKPACPCVFEVRLFCPPGLDAG